MKLAAQCYTVRNEMARDVWGTLEALRDLGLKYVEIGGTYGVPAAEFKQGLDRLGLRVSANHASMEDFEKDFDRVLEENLILEAPCICVPWIGRERYERGWAEVAKSMEPIGGRLREHGITFAYHNHAFEFEPENGRPGLEVFYEAADPKLLSALIDTYWVAYGGGDPAGWIRKLRGRVPQCHFKDGKLGEGEPRFLEVGRGDLDWDDIIAACAESGVEFAAIELDVCPHDPIESMRMSVDFLRAKGVAD